MRPGFQPSPDTLEKIKELFAGKVCEGEGCSAPAARIQGGRFYCPECRAAHSRGPHPKLTKEDSTRRGRLARRSRGPRTEDGADN